MTKDEIKLLCETDEKLQWWAMVLFAEIACIFTQYPKVDEAAYNVARTKVLEFEHLVIQRSIERAKEIAAAARIKRRKMLNLLDRPSLIASLPHGGICAEIGVDVGLFSEVILERNQPRELWLIDAWHHQDAETYGSDPANAIEAAQEGKYQEVLKRFADRPHVHVIREWSVVSAAKFPDEYFDWIHIDANHLQAGRDLAAWYPKVIRGGWVTGHDYCIVSDFITVKTDVDWFAAENGLRLFVAGLESEDVYERNYPSWAIQKP